MRDSSKYRWIAAKAVTVRNCLGGGYQHFISQNQSRIALSEEIRFFSYSSSLVGFGGERAEIIPLIHISGYSLAIFLFHFHVSTRQPPH